MPLQKCSPTHGKASIVACYTDVLGHGSGERLLEALELGSPEDANVRRRGVLLRHNSAGALGRLGYM